ncbi:MAG: ATP-binding protein [Thermoplasmata archaeon]|nr:ATP-binding protein [Thermoplasmata archaeon]
MHDDDLDFQDLSKFKKKEKEKFFPFTSIVGQQAMKKGLILVAANPRISSLIIVGENGTGKITAAQGIQAFLPIIEVTSDCLTNCDPRDRMFQCTDCTASGGVDGVNDDEMIEIKTPFIQLPVGVSKERVLGTFEKDGTFVPGIVAIANRGYILLERVNLHDADMVKTLLDIRDIGIHNLQVDDNNYRHPAQFSIIATYSPSEGKLDEELIKRFQLMVNTRSLKDIEERIEIVRRVEAFKEDPEDSLEKSRREEDGLRALIINSRRLLKRADIPSKSMNAIIEVLKAHEMDEPHLRDAMVEGVKANTVINDSVWASIEDVAEVVDMVMGHRIGKELES